MTIPFPHGGDATDPHRAGFWAGSKPWPPSIAEMTDAEMSAAPHEIELAVDRAWRIQCLLMASEQLPGDPAAQVLAAEQYYAFLNAGGEA